MDKIYSRHRLIIPKVNISIFNKKNSKKKKKTKQKLFSIIIVFIVAAITISRINNSISKILEQQCKMKAKSIATRISNSQATAIMKDYSYDDLFNTLKDSNRKYYNDKC